MYIHLGGDKVIRSSELIAIFDIASDKSNMLSHEGEVEKIGDEVVKSLVITESKAYYSPISSSTLNKRSRHFSNG